AAQNDKTIEAAKAKVDAFKAETERLKVAADIAHRNRSGIRRTGASGPLPSGGGSNSDFPSAAYDEGESEGPTITPPPNPSSVYSLTTGKVDTAGWERPNDQKYGLGWRVWVRESDGSRTGYGHMDPRTTPPVGTPVEVGDYIGNF